MKAILLLILLTSVWMHPAYAFLVLGMTQFQKACRDGADARVQFCVVDDTGLPVANARVNVFFDMIDRSKGKRVIGCTDTNGVFIAEAKTGGVLEIEVTGDGYYKTTDKMCFIEMENEHDVQEGKWQPWGMRKNIVLLPIKNPSAIRRPPSWKGCKELNKWIGFDLMISDFIKPYGKGEIADMEVMFEWDGLWRQKDYNGMTVKIRFSEKFSGGYYDNNVAGSEYTGVYHANLKKKYHQEFKYSERVISRNKKGYPSKYEKHMFDETKVLVVRSRCRLNDDGTLKSANYFQLSYIKFAGDEQGAAMKFMSIFNPTPNDTNLEPKR